MTESTPPVTSLAEYQLTPHERVSVLRRTPELLEVEATYAPGGKPPLRHRHPSQFERFAVLEGQLAITVDGKTRVLHPGDTATVGRGRAHAMAAAGDAGARVIWQTSPALDTEAWWAGLDELARAHAGAPPLPAVARLLKRHARVFELALPNPLPRLVVAMLALLPVRGGQAPVPGRVNSGWSSPRSHEPSA